MAFKVTVEPIIFLFMFTVYLWYPLCTELIFENIFGSKNKECGNNDTVCAEKKQMAQEESARLQLYIAAARHVPAFFSALVLGSFTDRYGRRPALILSCIGNTIWTNFLLLQVYFKFSVYYFLIGGMIDGICGGISTFLFASFAYAADTSNDESRTKRISLCESMVYIGGFIASVSGGLWSDKRGFAAPLFAVQLCNVLLILYIVFRLAEPRKVSKMRSYRFIQHFKQTLNLLISPTGARQSLWLVLLIFTILVAVLAGTTNIFVLFLLDKPFAWNYTNIGYFIAFNTLLNGIITLLALPEFNKHAGDFNTAMVGVIAACISSIIVGVSTVDWMLFFGSTVGAVGSMAIPTLRSEMSKMVSANSQGSLFSLMSAADILIVLISSSAMSKIYEETHLYYHGFCFLIEGGLAFIAIGLLIAHKQIKKRRGEDKEELIVGDTEPDETAPPVYVMSDLEDDDEILEDIKIKTQLSLRSPNQTTPDPPSRTQDPLITSQDYLTVQSSQSQNPTSSRQLDGADIVLDNSFETIDLNMDTQVVSFSNRACGHVTCSTHAHEPCVTNL